MHCTAFAASAPIENLARTIGGGGDSDLVKRCDRRLGAGGFRVCHGEKERNDLVSRKVTDAGLTMIERTPLGGG